MKAPGAELRTARCVVRLRRGDEAAELLRAVEASREHLSRWIRWGAEVTDLTSARAVVERERAQWEAGENFVLGVFASDDTTLIGGTGFHPRDGALGEGTTEVGMWIHPEHAGHGLATEVLLAVIEWGFTAWDWQRLEWRCDPRNVASVAVARRAGMVLDGTLRQNSTGPQGERTDSCVFSLLRAEWPPKDAGTSAHG